MTPAAGRVTFVYDINYQTTVPDLLLRRCSGIELSWCNVFLCRRHGRSKTLSS